MRKSWVVFICMVILLASVSIPQNTHAQDQQTIHFVREGETLTSIAAYYRTTTQALITANHLSDGDTIYVGERLIIPTRNITSAPTSRPIAPGTYTVQAGDTLSSISQRTGASVDALMAANKIADPGLIRIGQTLKIPNVSGFTDAPNLAVPSLADGSYTLTPSSTGPAVVVNNKNGYLTGLTLQTVSSGKQSLPLSCEARVAGQIALMYGLPYDEAAFLAQLPHSLNPRLGFVGSLQGRFYWPGDLVGSTAYGPGGYGVHVEGWLPTFKAISGFRGRLLSPSPAAAQLQIDEALRHGYPIAIWAILGFREAPAGHSVWIGPGADGKAVDCGGPAPDCNFLASGEHTYLILGRQDSDYVIYDPGSGDMTTYSRSVVITGITTYFAGPTGSAPGAVIIPATGDVPDLQRVPDWQS